MLGSVSVSSVTCIRSGLFVPCMKLCNFIRVSYCTTAAIWLSFFFSYYFYIITRNWLARVPDVADLVDI